MREYDCARVRKRQKQWPAGSLDPPRETQKTLVGQERWFQTGGW
jgi:hypothetical protein